MKIWHRCQCVKGIEAAKLPATKELMQMVSAMMKQGMSIDKNALLDMSKLMMSNAGARPGDGSDIKSTESAGYAGEYPAV